MSLVISNISFNFEQRPLLKGLNLTVQKGTIATLLGPSGSGKSTLLRMIAGLIPVPIKGSIKVDGQSNTIYASQIAMMMQQDLLLPWRNVLDNTLLSAELGPAAQLTKAKRELALELLHLVGLSEWVSHFPHELSGGMRQRVSLARALLQQRPYLLLDEPFGALDVGLRHQLYDLLKTINRSYGTTMLMVTHDFNDALSLSDDIFLLTHGVINHHWPLKKDFSSDFNAVGQLQAELRKVILSTSDENSKK